MVTIGGTHKSFQVRRGKSVQAQRLENFLEPSRNLGIVTKLQRKRYSYPRNNMFQTSTPVVGPSFHDREAELEALTHAIQRLAAGEPQCRMVTYGYWILLKHG